MKRSLKIIFISFCIFTSSCVSIDRKVLSEDVDNKNINNFDGKYKNIPIYFSEKINGGKDEEFTHLVGLSNYDYSKSFEIVVHEDEIELAFKLLEGEPNYVEKFVINDGAKYNGENSITLLYKKKCEITEMGFGCEINKLELFLNENGNLTVISTNKGIGLFGIFPVTMYLKYLSVFERIE